VSPDILIPVAAIAAGAIVSLLLGMQKRRRSRDRDHEPTPKERAPALRETAPKEEAAPAPPEEAAPLDSEPSVRFDDEPVIRDDAPTPVPGTPMPPRPIPTAAIPTPVPPTPVPPTPVPPTPVPPTPVPPAPVVVTPPPKVPSATPAQAAPPAIARAVGRIPPATELERNDPRHQAARRFARLSVSEILLYREAEVVAAREAKDILVRLRPDIKLCTETYEKRIPQEVRDQFDYLHDELVRQLAQGDPEKLGPIPPKGSSHK
jgi:hypothetical protein